MVERRSQQKTARGSRGCGSKPMVPLWGRRTHFGTYFSGGWDVHGRHGILTHGHFGVG